MSSDETTIIYGLVDPRDGCIRYVGKSDEPQVRLQNHLTDKRTCHRTSWLSNLKADGLKPEIVILEVVPASNWQEREIFYIDKLRQEYDLTNSTDGGDKPPSQKGRVQSEETRRKRSETMRGRKRPPEVGQKVSASKRGKPPSEKAKLAYLAMRGKPHSPEHIKKVADARRGKPWTAKRRQTYMETGR